MRKIICTVVVLLSAGMLFACGNDKNATNEKNELQTDENGNVINEELETDANGDIILEGDKNHTANEALSAESYTVKNVALWDAWTPSFEIKDGQVLQFDVDLTGGPTIYHSLNAAFCSIATDGITFPADMAGYEEYLVLRSDVFGWGDDYAGATYIGQDYVWQGETYDYKTVWNNADYDIYISRNGNTVKYIYAIRGGDGVTYNCGWEIKFSDVSKGCYVYFTGDAGVSFTLKSNAKAAYRQTSEGTSSGDTSDNNNQQTPENGIFALTKEYYYNHMGKLMHRYEYTYDADKNIVIKQRYTEEGWSSADQNEIFEYIYENGKLVKEIDTYEVFENKYTKWIEYKYNEAGQMSEKKSYDIYGALEQHFVYEYNEAGQLCKEKQKYVDTGEVWQTITNAYDDNGNLISKVENNYTNFGDENIEKKEYLGGKELYEYDSQNRLIKHEKYKYNYTWGTGTDIHAAEECEYKQTYEYDENGYKQIWHYANGTAEYEFIYKNGVLVEEKNEDVTLRKYIYNDKRDMIEKIQYDYLSGEEMGKTVYEYGIAPVK